MPRLRILTQLLVVLLLSGPFGLPEAAHECDHAHGDAPSGACVACLAGVTPLEAPAVGAPEAPQPAPELLRPHQVQLPDPPLLLASSQPRAPPVSS